MISAAWAWAAGNNLLRKNGVHLEEEARLVLNEKFECADLTQHQTELEGTIEVQDPSYMHGLRGPFPHAE